MVYKKMRLIGLLMISGILLLTGCSKDKEVVKDNETILNDTNDSNPLQEEKSSNDRIPLEEIPKDYSLLDAKQDGCLVIEEGEVTAGIEVWREFYKKTKKGEKAEVRIVNYYEMLGNVSEEYAKEHAKDYPAIYLTDLSYDGESYHIRHLEDGKEYSYDYDYLIERTGIWNNAEKVDHFFALANDPSLTYHDIAWSLLSSNSNDWVDFKYVWNELIDLKESPVGSYVSEDGMASLELKENNEFSFNRHIATNYDPRGTFIIEDSKLILYVSENEEYIFTMKDGTLIFESGELAETLVKKGMVFRKS